MRDAAVAVRDENDRGRDRERHERELPAVEEEDDRDDENGHDVLREEDEPVAEEEADRLQVDRRPRHELPRLAPVVEAEREPKEVRVQVVAQVVLDGERLLPGDEATPEHERSAHESERDDQRDLERQLPGVLGAGELVDHRPGQDRNEDGGGLGPDREDRGDDERRAVRTEECEQPHERPPVRAALPRVAFCPHLLVGYGPCSSPCRTCRRGGTSRRSSDSPRRSRRARGCSPSTPIPTTTVPSSSSRASPSHWRRPSLRASHAHAS